MRAHHVREEEEGAVPVCRGDIRDDAEGLFHLHLELRKNPRFFQEAPQDAPTQHLVLEDGQHSRIEVLIHPSKRRRIAWESGA